MESTVNDVEKAAVSNLTAGKIASPVASSQPVIAMGAAVAKTLRAVDDAGAIVLALTDASVVTLPPAADCKGQKATVVNIATSAAALVSVKASGTDGILGTVGSVTADGTSGKGWIGTKTTAIKGDFVTLVSDGVATWYTLGGVGVWAYNTIA
jgi:hypothetical protein